MSILLFVIILAILILVHEFGHFITAKKFKIKVEEFGIGFPPRIVSKKIGETEYSVNIIPFGGFVKILGEHLDDESMGGAEKERSIYLKPKWVQVLVLSAGVIFNIIFAWILISICFMSGMPASVEVYPLQTKDAKVIVLAVEKNSPAEKCGLKVGDSLLNVRTEKDNIKSDFSVGDFQVFVSNSGGKEIILEVGRNGLIFNATTTAQNGTISKKPIIGVMLDKIGIVKMPIYKAFYDGGKHTIVLAKSSAVGLASFVWDAVNFKADLKKVSGPVGIASYVGQIRSMGIIYLISFAAFISINLAIINLIPFPALDGGRLLFILIEAIRKKAISPKIANILNGIGFVLLIILMVVITISDIWKLIF